MTYLVSRSNADQVEDIFWNYFSKILFVTFSGIICVALTNQRYDDRPCKYAPIMRYVLSHFKFKYALNALKAYVFSRWRAFNT